jgi:hypothetical protein
MILIKIKNYDFERNFFEMQKKYDFERIARKRSKELVDSCGRPQTPSRVYRQPHV